MREQPVRGARAEAADRRDQDRRAAGDPRVTRRPPDPDAGGAHHSLSCSNIDRIEENRVILDCSADQARKNWRDESRSRALFERDDQGEMGPRILDRSFEGTYR